jgi:hypothetical protein
MPGLSHLEEVNTIAEAYYTALTKLSRANTATNNPYFASNTSSDPQADATDPADYIGVASVVYPQTAAAVMLSTIQKIKTGRNQANREPRDGLINAIRPLTCIVLSALAALVLAHQNFTDDASKSRGFKREVVVLTHGKKVHRI